jgi:hypothetical protein
MVEANCKVRAADALEIHLTVQIVHVFHFDYLRMNVEIFVSLFAGWNSHNWVVNLILLEVLGRPGTETVNYWDIRVVVKWVFEKWGGFRLVTALLLFLPSQLAGWDHVWAGGLLVSFKYNPIRLLPNVTVELFVAIESCHIYFADPNYVTYLNNVRQLAQLVCKELDWRECCCGITSQCRCFEIQRLVDESDLAGWFIFYIGTNSVDNDTIDIVGLCVTCCSFA